jgi:esterase
MMNKAVDLHYSVQGEGPALVILHGLYGSGTNWARHAAWLAQSYRVLLPDLRNHGRSPHHPDMSYPAMAADLMRLLDREGLGQALLLGHSMGGKAAMTLALSAPERVSALVVADIAPVTYPEREHASIIAALQALPLASLPSRQAADHILAKQIGSTMVRQFLLTNLQRREAGFQWRLPLEILARQLPVLQGFPDAAGRYDGPALFIHGASSDYVLPLHHARIRELFPRARIEAVADAGHWLHVEQPDAFAAQLRRFLETAV